MWLQQQNNLAETTSVYLSFLTVLRNYLIPARSEENTLTNYFYSPQKQGHCRWRQSRIVKHLSSGYKKGPGLETRELSEEGWSTPNPALCVCGGECWSTLRCPTNPSTGQRWESGDRQTTDLYRDVLSTIALGVCEGTGLY